MYSVYQLQIERERKIKQPMTLIFLMQLRDI